MSIEISHYALTDIGKEMKISSFLVVDKLIKKSVRISKYLEIFRKQQWKTFASEFIILKC